MIDLDRVTVTRGDVMVLDIPALTMAEHRVGLIGANGSGKSTLARLFNGLLLPTTGEVLVDGLSTKRDGKTVRRRVGFVFQNPDNQIVFPTVAEDLAFGLKSLDLAAADKAERVEESLIRFGLADKRDRLTHQLSEGEKQMLAIAGVTAMRPGIIVFDEPTTMLDLGNRKKIMSVIDGLAEKVVLISHDLDALRGFDRIICLHQGRVHADGPPAEVIDAYRALFP
jgi:biotin transport system ATP-binding protein